jgi:hypothetical protein
MKTNVCRQVSVAESDLAWFEYVRRCEVSRTLKKIELTPHEKAIVEQLSRTLVSELVRGPITDVAARVEKVFREDGRVDGISGSLLLADIEVESPARKHPLKQRF